MNAGEVCNREVVVAYRNTSLAEAAGLMRSHHVGSIVVVVDRLSERVPVGILTDRDIVVAVVAKGIDPRTLAVGEVMGDKLVTVREQDGVADALRLMREHGVRRIPVLNHSGALAGILTIDDVLEVISGQLGEFVRAIDRERVRETRARQ